jgi:hypothetical protein
MQGFGFLVRLLEISTLTQYAGLTILADVSFGSGRQWRNLGKYSFAINAATRVCSGRVCALHAEPEIPLND